MASRLVTEPLIPTYTLLHESDQREYRETGLITPKEDVPSARGSKYNFFHRGYGYKTAQRRDRFFLEELFDADMCAFQSDDDTEANCFFIVSIDFGIIKAEVFVENYLLDCETEYKTVVVMRLLERGQQIQLIGDRQFISVTRKHNYKNYGNNKN